VYNCLICLGESTKNQKAAVPWGEVTAVPWEWIKDWDKRIVIKEPTKMVSSDIEKLLRYLLERQTTGKELEWIQSAEDKMVGSQGGEGKGKGKTQGTNVESDDEDGEGMGKLDESQMRKKSVDDHKMDVGLIEGSLGSSSKRPHERLGCDETPPAKKQKKMVSDSSPRYGACQISLTLLI
jgi:hypothetical protein